jgi:hypothetical protein
MEYLLKELIVATDRFLNACKDESIDDLCYPIDYANPPFFILENLGVDVERLSRKYVDSHASDIDIANDLKTNVIPRLRNELYFQTLFRKYYN